MIIKSNENIPFLKYKKCKFHNTNYCKVCNTLFCEQCDSINNKKHMGKHEIYSLAHKDIVNYASKLSKEILQEILKRCEEKEYIGSYEKLSVNEKIIIEKSDNFIKILKTLNKLFTTNPLIIKCRISEKINKAIKFYEIMIYTKELLERFNKLWELRMKILTENLKISFLDINQFDSFKNDKWEFKISRKRNSIIATNNTKNFYCSHTIIDNFNLAIQENNTLYLLRKVYSSETLKSNCYQLSVLAPPIFSPWEILENFNPSNCLLGNVCCLQKYFYSIGSFTDSSNNIRNYCRKYDITLKSSKRLKPFSKYHFGIFICILDFRILLVLHLSGYTIQFIEFLDILDEENNWTEQDLFYEYRNSAYKIQHLSIKINGRSYLFPWHEISNTLKNTFYFPDSRIQKNHKYNLVSFQNIFDFSH